MKGYVYHWLDTATGIVYIGARRGDPVGDKYICSSPDMLDEYKKRPQDFVRSILFKGKIEKVSDYEWAYQIHLFENKIPCYNKKPTRYQPASSGHFKIFSKCKKEHDLFAGESLFK